jgi:hypothetical protein
MTADQIRAVARLRKVRLNFWVRYPGLRAHGLALALGYKDVAPDGAFS